MSNRNLPASSNSCNKDFRKSEKLKINKSKINSNVNLPVKADAENLPFSENFFDLTGIGFGVRNFDKLERCISEIFRVIKPGGRFLTIEMFKNQKSS